MVVAGLVELPAEGEVVEDVVGAGVLDTTGGVVVEGPTTVVEPGTDDDVVVVVVVEPTGSITSDERPNIRPVSDAGARNSPV